MFGASAALFGVIALLWRDVATWQTMSRLWRLPFGSTATVGTALMIVLIAGGVTLPARRTVRLGAVLLSVVYASFALVCVPPILASPALYITYGSFFEQFSLLCGALAAGGAAFGAVAVVRAARLGLALCAASFAISQAVYLRFTASLVPPWMPLGGTFWAGATTIAFVLAAVAIATGREARLAMQLMGLMIALFGLLVWLPAVVARRADHSAWSELALTFAIAGATWTVAVAAAGGGRSLPRRRR